MDENKGASITGKLEKKEDQEETNSFILFHSQFWKMSLAEPTSFSLAVFEGLLLVHLDVLF